MATHRFISTLDEQLLRFARDPLSMKGQLFTVRDSTGVTMRGIISRIAVIGGTTISIAVENCLIRSLKNGVEVWHKSPDSEMFYPAPIDQSFGRSNKDGSIVIKVPGAWEGTITQKQGNTPVLLERLLEPAVGAH